MKFESVKFENIPAILEMMEAFNVEDGYPFNYELSRKNLQTFLNEKNLGRIYLVQDGNNIIGYSVIAFSFSFEHGGRDAFVDELYLKQGYRNKGIGTKFMRFLENESAVFGVKVLHLEVERKNKTAKKLYTNSGYKDYDRLLLSKKL